IKRKVRTDDDPQTLSIAQRDPVRLAVDATAVQRDVHAQELVRVELRPCDLHRARRGALDRLQLFERIPLSAAQAHARPKPTGCRGGCVVPRATVMASDTFELLPTAVTLAARRVTPSLSTSKTTGSGDASLG